MIVEHKGHKIHLYDGIQELPILRFVKFNKYMMMTSEVGSSFEDYEARTATVIEFLEKGMVDEAILELENRRQAVFNCFNETSPKGRSFSILVKKINEKNYNSLNIEELDEVLKHLDRIGLGHVDCFEALISLKKKSN